MSRNFVVLSKTSPMPLYAEPEARDSASYEPGEFASLIRTLFAGPAAVAIIGCGVPGGASPIAERLAAELGASGKRVALVAVRKVLETNPAGAPDEADMTPGNSPSVWLWPAPGAAKIEFFRPSNEGRAGKWLHALRQSFDAVVLDCPEVSEEPNVTEVAAMADAVVLAVEAGLTTKEQLHRDHQTLQKRGARIAGSILAKRS